MRKCITRLVVISAAEFSGSRERGQRIGEVGGMDDMVLCYAGWSDKTSLMKRQLKEVKEGIMWVSVHSRKKEQ